MEQDSEELRWQKREEIKQELIEKGSWHLGHGAWIIDGCPFNPMFRNKEQEKKHDIGDEVERRLIDEGGK